MSVAAEAVAGMICTVCKTLATQPILIDGAALYMVSFATQ